MHAIHNELWEVCSKFKEIEVFIVCNLGDYVGSAEVRLEITAVCCVIQLGLITFHTEIRGNAVMGY